MELKIRTLSPLLAQVNVADYSTSLQDVSPKVYEAGKRIRNQVPAGRVTVVLNVYL